MRSIPEEEVPPAESPGNGIAPEEQAKRRLRPFRAVSYAANVLLLIAILIAAYCSIWEYSTREYLKGFSDAVVPDSSATLDKVHAILQWMSHGPTRFDDAPDDPAADRDPTDTLNYASLLRVCGTATNAFVNLADSAGLSARRLLLLDSRGVTMHVVAEVLVGSRWIIVDPAFRTILIDSNGKFLSREDVADPAVLADATRDIPGYSPAYTFGRTVHVRLSRMGVLGPPVQGVLDRLFPGWDESAAVSLFFERDSLAALVLSIAAVAFLSILCVGLRIYGERRLGFRPVRIRDKARRAFHAFADTTS